MSTHLGESQRVSITESAVALRDRWLCHPYVHPDTIELAEKAIRDIHNEEQELTSSFQIGFGANKKTRHMMPSGHKAFLVNNVRDVDLLLMHNKTFAAEISHAVSSRKRVEIVARAKQLGVKVTNAKARVTTEV